MSRAPQNPPHREFDLADLAATERLAGELAALAAAGDVIAMWGDLGAGKTAFARAFIRSLGSAQGTPIDEVPSPTFTIVKIYDELDPAVWHVDLYRLEGRAETVELGLEEAFEEAVTLIEWPDRLDGALPSDRLDLELHAADDPDARTAVIRFLGRAADRFAALGGPA